MFKKRLKSLRTSTKLTQEETAKKLGIARTTYAMYEQGKREPDIATLNSLASYFNVSVDYLLGTAEQDQKLPELTKKEELDIKKDLEKIVNSLSSNQGYAHFGGESLEDLDEEDKELLINSLENTMKLAKKLAKQKFTPHKYRK